MNKNKKYFEDKIILVAGGAGFIGRAIVKKLLKLNPRNIRVLDIDEFGLFDLEHKLRSDRVRYFIGDLRDKDRLKRAIEGVDIVFNAAALKHVPLCEYNPFEAVKTNVVGTQNLIEVAIDEEVNKFITISTDKSVNPVSVMGATKLLAERLTISANYYKGKRASVFSCVRFGNILGSRGSVVPLFVDQINILKEITITHPKMTRYIMSKSQAVDMILEVTIFANGGEIFILKMPALNVYDLAEVMIEEISKRNGYNPTEIKINIIGKRPGEKLFEELITESEIPYSYENEDLYVVRPQVAEGSTHNIVKKMDLKPIKRNKLFQKEIKILNKNEIRTLLKEYFEKCE
jgi:FlaA1/EpsC-like NDP-sugar epimerase